MSGLLMRASLAGQTFVVIRGGGERDFLQLGRVVGLDPAGEARALDGLGAQVIERLDAELPGAEVEHEEVPFVDVGRDERSEERRVGKECRSRWSPYH